jgi:ParB family chromosome partitioning protein
VAKTTGLGQGVGALFGDSGDEERFFECDIKKIFPNKHQPRVHFDTSELDELSQSIVENGVIQPLIVSYRKDNNSYELVAGERRLRASRIAGLETVPVVVKNIDSEDTFLEMALIENIQRTDLNALEEAKAYKKLIDRFGYTQEQTAKRVGKKRSTVANTLRLLLLPTYVKDDLLARSLSEGHARALLRIVDDPATLKDIRDQIIVKKLSVRQTEQLIRRNKTKASHSHKTSKLKKNENSQLPTSYRKSFENQLTNKLDSKVTIHPNGNRGKIEIEYYSLDDLERLVSLVSDEQ